MEGGRLMREGGSKVEGVCGRTGGGMEGGDPGGGGGAGGGRDSTSGMAIINAHSRHAMTTGGNDGMEGG